jgi:Tol biopolymer transport system component
LKKSFSLLLTLISLAFGVLLLNCGNDHRALPPSQTQTSSFTFMQEVPGTPYIFTPMLGKFSASGGNVTFSATALKDPSSGQTLEAEFYSITLGAGGKKGALELYGGPDGNSGQWDIWVGDISTANLVQISNDTYADAMPQLSPDGTKVVYASERVFSDNSYWWQLITRNADGTGSEQVLPTPSGVTYEWAPAYSPDGSKIAFVGYGNNGETNFYGIWIMNADGSNPQMLTNPLLSGDCNTCYDQNPAFSSDGTKIAFSRVNYDTYPTDVDVYIMNAADGSNPTKLTDSVGVNFDPMFLTIGGSEKVLFSSNRDNLSLATSAGFELYSMNKDGSGVTRLTSNSRFDAFCGAWYTGGENLTGRGPAQHSMYQQHHTSPVHW